MAKTRSGFAGIGQPLAMATALADGHADRDDELHPGRHDARERTRDGGGAEAGRDDAARAGSSRTV